MLLLVAVIGTTIWSFHRAMLIPVLCGLAGVSAITLHPERAFALFSLSTISIVTSLALVMARVNQRDEA